MEKIQKAFLGLFIVIVFSNVFSAEIPNEKIYINPQKEVKTVRAVKNRDHAEMRIKINKLIPKKVKGKLIGGMVEIPFQEDEGILNSGEKFIFGNKLEDMDMKKIGEEREFSLENGVLRADARGLNLNFYIGKTDLRSRKLTAVYAVSADSGIKIAEDIILDFKDMIYDGNRRYYRVQKEFTVINPTGRDINFSLKDDKILIPHTDLKSTLKVEEIKVEKISNFKFRLEGVIKMAGDIPKGSYKSQPGAGEIEVLVEIN